MAGRLLSLTHSAACTRSGAGEDRRLQDAPGRRIPVGLRHRQRAAAPVFVVWQQGREATLDRGTFGIYRDMGGVFDAPATNVFLVKWAYWMNFQQLPASSRARRFQHTARFSTRLSRSEARLRAESRQRGLLESRRTS